MMAITLKSRREIELMRRAGSVVAKVLSKLEELAKPGINTAELDRAAELISAEAGAEDLFRGVIGPSSKVPFPGAICASINEQVVHGIPCEDVCLKEGDVLSIDYGARLNGYCGDAAVTVAIGKVSEEKARLIAVTRQALEIAIDNAAPQVRWSQIAEKMQKCAEAAGFAVVRELVGHGIGRNMHEGPQLPNFVSDELLKNDIVLTEGMVLAVEPMINIGTEKVRTLKDGWTVIAKDKSCSAHFEHTIAIVEKGCEVLTVI